MQKYETGVLSNGTTVQAKRIFKQKLGEEGVTRRASAKLEEGDIKGALRLLTSSDDLAPSTKETLDRLMTLHPPQPMDRRANPVPSADIPLHVSPSDVKRAILYPKWLSRRA